MTDEATGEARRRRAARLREQMGSLGTVPEGGRRVPGTRPLSPRDFIHERMDEIARERDKEPEQDKTRS